MFIHIIDAKYISGYKIWLKFNDGTEGEVDLKDELWGEMFEPLKESSLFKTVGVNKEIHTIGWKNGADLAPQYLYNKIHH